MKGFNPNKICTVIHPDRVEKISSRKLLDYVDDVISDNLFFGEMHGYTAKEIRDYEKEAKALRSAIKAHMGQPDPVFVWDSTTELPTPELNPKKPEQNEK